MIGTTSMDGKGSTVSFITKLLGFLGRKARFFSTISSQTGDDIVEATLHGISQRMNGLGDMLFEVIVLTKVMGKVVMLSIRAQPYLEVVMGVEIWRQIYPALYSRQAGSPSVSMAMC